MRFYDILVAPSLSTPTGAKQWTSFPNGSYDPQALDVVFDIQVSPMHTPSGGSVISVHGVSIDDLYQAQNFKGQTLSLFAGMLGGLPLSAAQPPPGLVTTSTIFGAFGNWQGTEQSLDFLIVPSDYTPESPGNIVFRWEPGQPFASAISQTLAIAYPLANVSILVSPELTTEEPIQHLCSTAVSLGSFIEQLTRETISPKYPGVHMFFNGTEIKVTDYSVTTLTPTELKFADLIGQPTWLSPPTLTLNTILRADIGVVDIITLPQKLQSLPGLALTPPTTHAASFQTNQSRGGLTFSGEFFVTGMRSVGHFRGTDDDAWVSVIQAVPVATYGL